MPERVLPEWAQHGGMIEPGTLATQGDSGPELVYTPESATVIDTRMPKTVEELRAFIRAEVRKALNDVARGLSASIGGHSWWM